MILRTKDWERVGNKGSRMEGAGREGAQMDHVSGIYLVTSDEAANCPSFVFNLEFKTSCYNIDINTF